MEEVKETGTPQTEQPQEQVQQEPEVAITSDGELQTNLSDWGLPDEGGEQPEGQEETKEEKPDYYTPEEIRELGIDRLDPNRIPPELLPWYKSMQADYTKKTQALAEERKTVEKLLDKALSDPELAKKLMADADFLRVAQSHPQLAQKLQAVSQLAQPTQPKNPLDAIVEQAKRVVEAQLGEQFDEFNPKHIVALNLATQQILQAQVQVLTTQRRIQEIKEKEPHFDEIDRLAQEKLNQLPFAEAAKIIYALRTGNIEPVLQFWEAVRKEFYQQKINQKEPPKVESAGKGEVKTKPAFDPRELANLTEDEKARWLIEAGLV